MSRRVTSLQTLIEENYSKKCNFLNRWRRHSILLACISSGFLYHRYIALPQPPVPKSSYKSRTSVIPLPPDHVMFAANEPAKDSRTERLLTLRNAVESELPLLFERRLSDFSSTFMDPGTIVLVERKNGVTHTIRNHSLANTALFSIRLYCLARSSYRRVEILNIFSDPEKWILEVNLRVVLLPSPSLRESRLPPDLLLQKLESNARWHEFRITFHVSESAEVSQIRITKFVPPQRPSEAIRSLRPLSFFRRLSPALPSARRLPSPTPFVLLQELLLSELDSPSVHQPLSFFDKAVMLSPSPLPLDTPSVIAEHCFSSRKLLHSSSPQTPIHTLISFDHLIAPDTKPILIMSTSTACISHIIYLSLFQYPSHLPFQCSVTPSLQYSSPSCSEHDSRCSLLHSARYRSVQTSNPSFFIPLLSKLLHDLPAFTFTCISPTQLRRIYLRH
ncbi:unnamed protein product [Dicrocoelium dendriticum]|nr:unnamed protein product [Dicrocoelium dendriticum]